MHTILDLEYKYDTLTPPRKKKNASMLLPWFCSHVKSCIFRHGSAA